MGLGQESNFSNGVSTTKRNSSIQQKNWVDKIKTIRIGFADGTTETSTAWTLPTLAFVTDVLVDVITAEATGATKTLDVGPLSSETGGDANGYLDGVSVAATGVIQTGLTVTETTGVNETYISAIASTRGVLLEQLDSELGADVAGNTGYVNTLVKNHYNTNANNISWTPGSADFAELKADIIIFYKELV